MSSETTKLPGVIQSFIEATNAHDGEAYIAAFGADALVNDAARNFQGKDPIRKWSDKEIINAKVTFKTDEIVEHYGEFMVTALTDGDYDKTKSPDPTYLDYFFTVRDHKIVRLIIVKNREKSAK